MCAGSTVFAPMEQLGVRPWMRVAVIGMGGLGHLAVQFLARMGCEVTAISSRLDKEAEARDFGASRFVATKDASALEGLTRSFDFIFSTVAADIPWDRYIDALRPEGRLVVLGNPPSEIHFPAFPLLLERSVSGSSVGSPSETARMLDFAARTGVRPIIEQFALEDVNRALDRVRSGRVRFHTVLAV
jgi:uncharacterized zinc-type alcohol dehydrogenase-like protein